MSKSITCPIWKSFIAEQIKEPYLNTLQERIKKEREEGIIYPEANDVLRVFKEVPYKNIKVVILGQDPYHTPGMADGLAFSTKSSICPPSLQNIFKELLSDWLHPFSYNECFPSNDLTSWAKQGVFLLNTVLTVRKGEAGSHKDYGWKIFTERVIIEIAKSEEPIVFMLWGAHAKEYKKYIKKDLHLVLEANHPSPLSANKSGWFGCKHFSRANKFLGKCDKIGINWSTRPIPEIENEAHFHFGISKKEERMING